MRDASAKKCVRLCQSTSSLAQQAQIGFVHERGRLERVASAVTTKMAGGAPAELAVDERQQFLLRVRIPSPTTRGAAVSPLPLTPIACLPAPWFRAVTQPSRIFRVNQ